MKRLIIVDVSNYIFRAYFAIRPLHAPDGTPVNAVYGVLSMIHNMIKKYQPTHLIIAKDTKEGSFRKEVYVDYKANRTDPPDELIPQFSLVDELISALKIPEIKMARYEADDIIGSIAVQWKNNFDEILIASGDKDLMQFVTGPVKMLDTMKEKTFEREDVKDKFGVYPEQIVDYLALIGDSSDNIPGVPGIGPKGAQNLLEEFGNLETILDSVDKIKNKRCQTALAENKEKALLSHKLASIIQDLPLPLSVDDSRYALQVDDDVVNFLEKVGFRSWLTKLSEFKVEKKETTSETVSHKSPEIPVIKAELSDLKKLLEAPKISLEVCSIDSMDQIQTCSRIVASSENMSIYIEMNLENNNEILNAINDYSGLIICYQTKPLLLQLRLAGITPKVRVFDVAQAHFNLSPDIRHDFSTITEEFLFERFSEVKGQADLFGSVSEDELKSLGIKTQYLLLLEEILRKKMRELGVERAYDDLDIPLINVLAAIELEGISLDVDFFKTLEINFAGQIETIEEKVKAIAGDKINLRSPKQVGELLFEKLQLPVVKKTKTGYSTDAEVLNELAAMNISEIPELLLNYRELEKLQSTYVKTLPLLINGKSNKIHSHFQPSNAATGRLSSDNPNLQNIPVRTENGRKLRRGFVPSKDRTLISADYSQVELRILAHFSQDPNMLDAFKHDLDIHRQTAAEIFEIPLEKVTKDERNSAKAINFGLMYGQTSFGLSQALRISQGEAKKYITNYFKKFQAVKTFLDGLKELAEEKGYCETLFGRKRTLADIRSTNRQVKAMAERIAINSPIQGTAADIIKLAMINIQNELEAQKLKSKMILQVHDELIFDVVSEEIELMKDLIRHHMENAVELSIPLKVEMGVGQNWYDLK